MALMLPQPPKFWPAFCRRLTLLLNPRRPSNPHRTEAMGKVVCCELCIAFHCLTKTMPCVQCDVLSLLEKTLSYVVSSEQPFLCVIKTVSCIYSRLPFLSDKDHNSRVVSGIQYTAFALYDKDHNSSVLSCVQPFLCPTKTTTPVLCPFYSFQPFLCLTKTTKPCAVFSV